MQTYRYVYYVLAPTPVLFLLYALYDLSQTDMTTRAWTAGPTILMILLYSLFIGVAGLPLVLISWRKGLGVRGPLLATFIALGGWWYLFSKIGTRGDKDKASETPARPIPTVPTPQTKPIASDAMPLEPSAVVESVPNPVAP